MQGRLCKSYPFHPFYKGPYTYDCTPFHTSKPLLHLQMRWPYQHRLCHEGYLFQVPQTTHHKGSLQVSKHLSGGYKVTAATSRATTSRRSWWPSTALPLRVFCHTASWCGMLVALQLTEKLSRRSSMWPRKSGCPLPTLDDISSSWCLCRARKIIKDPFYPGQHLFNLLLSGKQYRPINNRTNKIMNNFLGQQNSQPLKHKSVIYSLFHFP